MNALIDKLTSERLLTKDEFIRLIDGRAAVDREGLRARAEGIRREHYGDAVYIRGLIEWTNVCKNDCYYCGIRAGNHRADRYRLTKSEILSCCEVGYGLGFRTFVLQGGEDPGLTDALVEDTVRAIKQAFPAAAVTLSLGERHRDAYARWRQAGADRYLLRHETANAAHYALLHPKELTLARRQDCLFALKDLGYQVGTGFMVGSPFQTAETLAEDLLFIQSLQPDMIGIGPFLPHRDTPFASEPGGTMDDTLFFLSLLRLMLPHALLPATTALGTVSEEGRVQGMRAGANVVMPNLSPERVRQKYMLYDGKAGAGLEAAESVAALGEAMAAIGYRVDVSRGDCILH